jgi:SAM-dependent methyltransferase
MSKAYEYQPSLSVQEFFSAVAALRQRVTAPLVEAWVPATNQTVVDIVTADLFAARLPISTLPITPEEFRRFAAAADYASRYPQYYTGCVPEKILEHFVSLRLLEMGTNDVFVDVASEGSPLPEIARRLYGATTYAQDIMYPPGIAEGRIGGDACAMPVPDGFASKVALTCSLEHFEGDGDTRLFLELGRILAPGGRVVVVPLYMYTRAAVQTDPCYSVSADVPFDPGATIFCAKGWANRLGRFYSAASLRKRVIGPSGHLFDFAIYRLAEPAAIDGRIYARFAMLATRRLA